jgi:hypothetical protein
VWVVDADIESFFDRLGFDLVLDCVQERVSDRRVLRLIRLILEAGVLDGETLSHPGEGAPQGGPLYPCSPMPFFTAWTGPGCDSINAWGRSCAMPMMK